MPPSAAPAISVELALSAEPSMTAAASAPTAQQTETAPQESTPPPEPEAPASVPQEAPAPEAVKTPAVKKPVPKAPARKAPTAEPQQTVDRSTATPSSHATANTAAPVSSGAPTTSEGAITPASATADHLNNPPPQYPVLALKRKRQGTVQLRVQVLASGRPGEIQIVRSSGRDILYQAAVAAVRQWSFVAARRGGTPMESWASFPLSFKLQ
ncbi:MAG: TonB family protein [Symbiopectobacterium sp.]|uniref:energy transducer TonB n=1 Tax=Symbiopectobacterium sp. TaxID=2952789 RepID=UPI0039E9C3EF